ncbi:uncharacterized protein LOC143289096 [Babylonia areolata]|uniref:uncharacterized protein LOC143289096 n=1 Tax=Babylonia areolata TaxID=304850 RepID=UPI003FD5BD6E
MTSFLTAHEMTSPVAGDTMASLLRVDSKTSCQCDDYFSGEKEPTENQHQMQNMNAASADHHPVTQTDGSCAPQPKHLNLFSSFLSVPVTSRKPAGRLLLPLLLALAVVTSLTVGVTSVDRRSSASVTKRETKELSHRTDRSLLLSERTSSWSLLSHLQRLGKQNGCHGSNGSKCQTRSPCQGQDDEQLCRCPRGYYLHPHHRRCSECSQPCPKGHYLLGACSAHTKPICVACSTCTRTQYVAAACTSTSDTLCVDITFPLRLLPTSGTNCSDGKDPITASHSPNVFLERLVSMKELETPMYVTNNQQTQDFVWHRESGIDIVVGISGVYLIPEYRELPVADDSQFFLTQSMETQDRLRLFADTRKQYCRHPVPDYYYLHLEVLKNRTSAAQVVRCDSRDPAVPRCPSGYRDGDRYLKWDINKRCYKYFMYLSQTGGGRPLVVLRDELNSVVCTEETPLGRAVFGVSRPVTLEMLLPPTECALARLQCDQCLAQSACQGLDKHKSCCGTSCYNKAACHKQYSAACPPPQVECGSGEVHRFTVIPVFSSMSEEWRCHLTYQRPSYLYNISYTVSIPDLGLQLPTQTYTAKMESLEEHRRRSGRFHFIRVWHDTRMPLARGVILRGDHLELGASNPNHMQPFVLHPLKTLSDFQRHGTDFLVSKKGRDSYTAAVQFQRPFLYSSTSWYGDGCSKNVSAIFPNQTLYREEELVKVTAKMVDKGGDFWYQVSHRDKSPYIKLSVPEGESILRWFMGSTVQGALDGDSLTTMMYWDHAHYMWTVRVNGQVKTCPAIFTLQIFNKMMSSCAGIYDVVVACPHNFTLTFNLSRTEDDEDEDLPDIFVLVLNDTWASHQLVLSSVLRPVSLPVTSLHARHSAGQGGGAGDWSMWWSVVAVVSLGLLGAGVVAGVYLHVRCSASKAAAVGEGEGEASVGDRGNLHHHRQQQQQQPPTETGSHDRQLQEKHPAHHHDIHPLHVDVGSDDLPHPERTIHGHPLTERSVDDHRYHPHHHHHLHPETSQFPPELSDLNYQHTENCPENYLHPETHPLSQHHDEEADPDDPQQNEEADPHNDSLPETIPQHQNHAEESHHHHYRSNPEKGSPPSAAADDALTGSRQSKPGLSQKSVCLFVLLYITYSVFFTFSVTLSILYLTHRAVTGGVGGVANFTWELQRELNASFHKVQRHEREEELRLFRSVDSRLQACAHHLQRQNREHLQGYLDHLTSVLDHVYLQGGAIETLAGTSIMQNSSMYAEEIQQFMVDCNRTVQSVLDRFDHFFLLHVKDLSRSGWLDFAREVFLTQEGDRADRKYMSQDQLARFLDWLQVDKVHELFAVSQAVAEGVSVLKLPSPSDHLKHTVTSPFRTLPSSLPAEPMVAAHTFLLLHPPPSLPAPSPLPLSPASTDHPHHPRPQAAFLYSDRPSGGAVVQGDDVSEDINGSRSQPLTGEEAAAAEEEEEGEGVLGMRVHVMLGLLLAMDALLFAFRMSWMVRQLRAARAGQEDRVPTDPVSQKLLAIQTGHHVSRMQDIYQTHRYTRQNRENLTSEERASHGELNVFFCQAYPRSKDDILRQIMEQKINGGRIGLGLGQQQEERRPPEVKPPSPQHVVSQWRAVREMWALLYWLQRVVVSQLLWRAVVTCVLVVLLCVLLYTADLWLTADNLRILVGGQSALRDLQLQVHMTNRHLADLAAHLSTVLQGHTHTVRQEMSASTHLLASTLNTQRDLLVSLLERVCSGTATPMCNTLSNFTDLPLPDLPVWLPCNFLPPVPTLYRDVGNEDLDQMVAQQLSPLLRTAKRWLSCTCSLLTAALLLLFLCHAGATVARCHLLLRGRVARVQIFQISESTGNTLLGEGPYGHHHHKPGTMQRSASWLESCESGVYVGENEADSHHHHHPASRDV